MRKPCAKAAQPQRERPSGGREGLSRARSEARPWPVMRGGPSAEHLGWRLLYSDLVSRGQRGSSASPAGLVWPDPALQEYSGGASVAVSVCCVAFSGHFSVHSSDAVLPTTPPTTQPSTVSSSFLSLHVPLLALELVSLASAGHGTRTTTWPFAEALLDAPRLTTTVTTTPPPPVGAAAIVGRITKGRAAHVWPARRWRWRDVGVDARSRVPVRGQCGQGRKEGHAGKRRLLVPSAQAGLLGTRAKAGLLGTRAK